MPISEAETRARGIPVINLTEYRFNKYALYRTVFLSLTRLEPLKRKDIVETTAYYLRQNGSSDSLEMLQYHIGSQFARIATDLMNEGIWQRVSHGHYATSSVLQEMTAQDREFARKCFIFATQYVPRSLQEIWGVVLTLKLATQHDVNVQGRDPHQPSSLYRKLTSTRLSMEANGEIVKDGKDQRGNPRYRYIGSEKVNFTFHFI